MRMENLRELIKSKWFDRFQSGLESRFAASGLTYSYSYEENKDVQSLVINLANWDSKTKIQFFENGDLDFHYRTQGDDVKEKFEKCSENDLHTMIAHAFIYLRDGNFDYHREWHSKLQSRK